MSFSVSVVSAATHRSASAATVSSSTTPGCDTHVRGHPLMGVVAAQVDDGHIEVLDRQDALTEFAAEFGEHRAHRLGPIDGGQDRRAETFEIQRRRGLDVEPGVVERGVGGHLQPEVDVALSGEHGHHRFARTGSGG